MTGMPTTEHSETSSGAPLSERELLNSGDYAAAVKAFANYMLAICIAVLLVYFWVEGKLIFSVPMLFVPLLATAVILLRRDRIVAGTRLLLWGLLLATMAGSYFIAGIATPSLFLLPTLTMSAFWMLGRREALMMFVAVALNASWQLYIQTHGWLPPLSDRPPVYFFVAIISVMIAALLMGNVAAKNLLSQYLKIRSMREELLRSKASLSQEIAERAQIEADLMHSEEQLRLVLEGSEQGFWDWDIAAGTVERNSRWAEMLGYTYDEIKHTAQQWTDFIHPDDRAFAWRSINDVLEGRAKSHKAEYRMLHKDGSIRWILDQANVMKRDEQGRPIRMGGTHTDITARKQLEIVILENTQRLRRILDNLFAYVALLDMDGVVQEVNNAPLDRAGYRREDVVGKYFYDAPWWNYDAEVKVQLIEAIHAAKHGRSSRYDVVVKMGNDLVPIDFQIAPVRDGSGQIVGLLPTAVDISERKALEDELNRQAHLDYLTGLDNRRSFMEKADIELSRAERYANPMSLLMIDVDLFKQINDNHGHQVGDLVLKQLARTFHTVLRQVDIVGRLGGEEFGVVLPEADLPEAVEVADRLREVIARTPVDLPAGPSVFFTVSIGAAVFDEKNKSIEAMLSEADKALYRAKQSGRNKVCS